MYSTTETHGGGIRRGVDDNDEWAVLVAIAIPPQAVFSQQHGSDKDGVNLTLRHGVTWLEILAQRSWMCCPPGSVKLWDTDSVQ